MQLKNKTKKIISFLIIFSTIVPAVLFFLPKQINAYIPTAGLNIDLPVGLSSGTTSVASGSSAVSNGTVAAKTWKDIAKDIAIQVLKAVASKFLQKMTQSTINWINSGFHGAPLFLQNPDSFFHDVAKSEVETVINQFGYDPRRFPFGKQFALNLINSYKSTADSDAAYSLSKVINDPVLLNNYQNNFGFGGWNGFLLNTQYPQNNYLGFQITAMQQISQKLAGTGQSPAQKVQSLLQQGQGFLSPQTCPSNPAYPKATNPYNPPQFTYNVPFPTSYNTDDSGDSVSGLGGGGPGSDQVAYSEAVAKWTADKAAARAEWAKANTCPGGLQNTTPGAVVASQITGALGTGYTQAIMGEALGNSISAIVNSLMAHFLDKGLNSLASTVNPAPPADNFSYNGLTLGSPSDSTTNGNFDAGPDQPIVLNDLKKQIEGETDVIAKGGEILGQDTDGTDIIATKGQIISSEPGNTTTIVNRFNRGSVNKTYTPGDIVNTHTELSLMDSDDPTNPGIIQLFGAVWPKARNLDICLPGPDVGWEDRLDKEQERIINIANKAGGADSDSGVTDAFNKELTFATKFFKGWISSKIMTELPSAPSYIDAIANIKPLSQKATELTDQKRTKSLALARLQSIDTNLNTTEFAKQPEPGSQEDADLVSIWKQYQAVKVDVSSSVSIETTRNDLSSLKDQVKKLDKLINDPQTGCLAERKVKGWAVPGGPTSLLGTLQSVAPAQNSGTPALPTNSEQSVFCDAPIAGGYSHGTPSGTFLGFIGPGTYKDLPVVNAKKVMSYKSVTLKSILAGGLSILPGITSSPSKTAYVDSRLSCNTIFNANVLDYKGDLPGINTTSDSNIVLPPDPGAGDYGTCTYTDGADPSVGMTQENCATNGGSWTPPPPPIIVKIPAQ